jgi:hypothetical protein
MGRTKAKGKAWRRMAFEKLCTPSLGDIQKPDRSNVLRGVLEMSKKQDKGKRE